MFQDVESSQQREIAGVGENQIHFKRSIPSHKLGEELLTNPPPWQLEMERPSCKIFVFAVAVVVTGDCGGVDDDVGLVFGVYDVMAVVVVVGVVVPIAVLAVFIVVVGCWLLAVGACAGAVVAVAIAGPAHSCARCPLHCPFVITPGASAALPSLR